MQTNEVSGKYNGNMEFHEVANIFPLMEGESFRELCTDIASNGLIEPIWVWQNKIVDGRNRYRACQEIGIQPDFREWKGTDEGVLSFVLALNLKRRHLTSSQRAAVAVDVEGYLSKLAKERQIRKPSNSVFEKIQKQTEPIHSAKQAAQMLGTNEHYVIDAKKLKEQEPRVFEQVLAGNITLQEAKKNIKEQERKESIHRQREEIENGTATLPDGVFEVICLDPPWQYGTEYDPNGRRAANPYPEMSLEEIGAIKLPTADDCILWLWTTHKFMRYSFALLDAWGFRDVAIVTWEKDRMGLGTWLRSQTEFCIMAVKGKPKVDLTNQTTILHGKMREHSRKPDEFYEMVDGLCVGRKLDYFSRENRKGWEQYGNDLAKFD